MNKPNKNWFKKLSQAKPMALPHSTDDWYGIGAEMVDISMPKSTADDEREQYPNAQFIGGGVCGVAYEENGKVIKYTCSSSEATAAVEVMRKPIPCAVKIHEVKPLQGNTKNHNWLTGKPFTLWRIISDKVKTIEEPYTPIIEWLKARYLRLLETDKNTSFQEFIEYTSPDMNADSEELKSYKKVFNDYLWMLQCLTENGFNVQDAHSRNIGYDNSGKLVLFDLGLSKEADPDLFSKTSQAKPMALPFSSKVPKTEYEGRGVIDTAMPPDIARQETEQHPSMQYIGQGAHGVAYHDTSNQYVVKYTTRPSEVNAARKIMEDPILCVVEVIDVIELNPTTNLYKIITEKVYSLSEDAQDFISNIYDDFRISKNKWSNVNWPPENHIPEHYRELYKEYTQLLACLEENGLDSYDAHEFNIGYNSDWKLVLFDLGLSVPSQ